MRMRGCVPGAVALAAVVFSTPVRGDDEPAFPLKADRVVFLGDSITHAGGYIAFLEAELVARGLKHRPELINLGLPSETCSGLSEPIHPFPRPDVHERLDRALEKTKPDVVVVCYGMNDGIYYPFSEERFARFRQGIETLEKKIHAAGARVVLLTPTVFDPPPSRPRTSLKPAGASEYSWKEPYRDYDRDVLARYAKWILSRRDKVEMVIDLRGPIRRFLEERRREDPAFEIAADGVHINAAGHRIVARTIANAWGLRGDLSATPAQVALAQKKQAVLHSAWLSHVGHKRPGMSAGLPLAEAQARAAKLDASLAGTRP